MNNIKYSFITNNTHSSVGEQDVVSDKWVYYDNLLYNIWTCSLKID